MGKVLPELEGKIDGIAIRVPTPNVSLVDLVFQSTSKLSAEAINEKLMKASEAELKDILACAETPLVSQDFMGNPHSAIVDIPSTMALATNDQENHMGKVFAWYDNEMGFSHRMLSMAQHMAEEE